MRKILEFKLKAALKLIIQNLWKYLVISRPRFGMKDSLYVDQRLSHLKNFDVNLNNLNKILSL